MSEAASNTRVIVPQMSYLELITIQIGTVTIPMYFESVSGGGIQVATARYSPPNRRNSKPMAGKYSIQALTLGKTFIPDDDHIQLLDAILTNLRDPGNPNNTIRVIRDVPNTAMGGPTGRSKIIYQECVPTVIPVLADSDTTQDASIHTFQLSFEVSDVEITVNGKTRDINLLIGGGWDGAVESLAPSIAELVGGAGAGAGVAARVPL